MGTVISILLDVLSILAIIVFGALIVVIIADLILCLFDDHQGIIFRRGKKTEEKVEEKTTSVQKSEDIVVYKDKTLESNTTEEKVKTSSYENVQEVDFEKAAQEQEMLNAKKQNTIQEPIEKKPEPAPQPKKNNDIFDDISVDDDFSEFLADVIKEAKKSDEVVKEENKLQEETNKELEELRRLKEEHQRELEEFKKLKEDFAREKEEQLALMKQNLDKANEEELEQLKQETIEEQESLEKEKAKLEEEKLKLVEDQKNNNNEETTIIIKDEEEINKLKYKNLMRMNNRLSRIIKDTEKLQAEKQKKIEKLEAEKQKALEKEAEQKAKDQERLVEIQKRNREILARQQQALKKQEINKKLENAKKSASKYQLNSKSVTIKKDEPEIETKIIEETVTTIEETIPGTDTVITTVEKTPMKESSKPIFEKEYYEKKLAELDEELKESEKELRQNKSEYIPLTRIYKAYERDGEKLRKKEMQVAKQKIALYGVNSTKADPVKKAKLDENLQTLSELKDSVAHCEEVIRKNKDRYPVLEKNNKLITKQIDRINDDIKVCEKAISYYNKKK